MDWIIQVILALQYCHSRHIMHVISTHNIFLTEHNKVVKLGDFGVVRSLENTFTSAFCVVL